MLVESIRGRNHLLHGLGWRRRRRRHLIKVRLGISAIRGWRTSIDIAGIGKLWHALVRRSVCACDRGRLCARGATTRASHAFGDAFEGHTQILAHTASAAAVRVRRIGIGSRRGLQGLLLWASLDGNVDRGHTVHGSVDAKVERRWRWRGWSCQVLQLRKQRRCIVILLDDDDLALMYSLVDTGRKRWRTDAFVVGLGEYFW